MACLDLNPRPVPEPLLGLAADVADDASVRAAITTAHEAFGGLDILVNNAAIGAVGTIEADTDDDWHRVFDVNVVGIVRVSRAALPYLRASAHAAIVNIGSIAAWLGLPQRALYSASKGAVQALTLAMAADHVAAGIRVNCVNPGTADTPWVRRLLDAADDPAAELAALRARQPTGRLTTPQEVAAAVAYLASPLSGSNHRQRAGVDGGDARLTPADAAEPGLSCPVRGSPRRRRARRAGPERQLSGRDRPPGRPCGPIGGPPHRPGHRDDRAHHSPRTSATMVASRSRLLRSDSIFSVSRSNSR